MPYNHLEIEARWQSEWAEAKCFEVKEDTSKPKYYALNMFPYPSGSGLHLGHLASYTPADIISRYKRAKGFNVLNPMGYDAFGLPAEQYAIQTGTHPEKTTQKSIKNFRRQLKSLGYSFDWSRELSTCDPKFYKWTQFIFKKLHERGLAYQKEVPVNWCPELKTVLANEEVVDGKSERGGHPVVRKPMKQWMLNITSYADRLLEDLDKLDWPEKTKEGQRNWIGKSEGAEVFFKVYPSNKVEELLRVYTTRPDTLFGCSFMVLAPEHPIIRKIISPEQRESVERYIGEVSHKSELERKAEGRKTGVFTGGYAMNPLNEEKVPIWIADYVLMDYGTGAIMAVPAHDTRDFEFAKTFDLPIRRVIHSDGDLPFEGDGVLINSGLFNGLEKSVAIQKITEFLESEDFGERKTQYKLRDWLFSRQRYWGEPFPIIHQKDGSHKALRDEELPVELPPVANYEPNDEGSSPIAQVPEFINYEGPSGQGSRDTDTMPGSAASSWYFLRYIDPHNNNALCDFNKQKYWMPVDIYVGGSEHTVGHLLYARFWQKVLFDAGLAVHDEPFQKLVHQGVLLGPDGQRMSKSRGNVVSPDDMRQQYGADASRVYISFIGPFEKDKPWSTNLEGFSGVRRFLERVWRLCLDEDGQCIVDDSSPPISIQKVLHKTIKKVETDIERLSFNTAVSAMMILVNEIYKYKQRPRVILKPLLQILAPFAPHLCEELWSKLGGKGLISMAPWPGYDTKLTADEQVSMGVQVNGKMRGTIQVSPSSSEEEAISLAKVLPAVTNAIGDQSIIRVIYRAGRILNIIVQ